MSDSLLALVDAALATVEDPEIHKPITELKMVKSRDVVDGVARVAVWLTVSGCPMRDTITSRVTDAVGRVPGVTAVEVELDVMSEEQRKELRSSLVGHDEREIQFAKPGNLTRVYAIASGKGGVGKSSITANLAVQMAQSGLSVGLVDADIYGHSIPHILGINQQPVSVDQMIVPPTVHGVACISMGFFAEEDQAVIWRGPMLHKALEQFLTDVYWDDPDVLLLDLPPGTGDVAISVAQLLPDAELVVVTTPQTAVAEVAIRAGMLAQQTHTRVSGVIENMSSFPCPHCGEPMDLFGSGGGQVVADTLSAELGTEIPLLGRVPFDVRLREGGDSGHPLVLSDPDAPASTVLREVATRLGTRARGLAGMSLGITPAGRL